MYATYGLGPYRNPFRNHATKNEKNNINTTRTKNKKLTIKKNKKTKNKSKISKKIGMMMIVICPIFICTNIKANTILKSLMVSIEFAPPLIRSLIAE